MKKIVILFLILFVSNVYCLSFLDRCQTHLKKWFTRDNVVQRDDFVRNADIRLIRLEQDLKAIRNSSEESLLEAQGFQPSYYRGVDQARESTRVHEYLQEIKADPKKTHIPYFADQVNKMIADFERNFKEHYRGDTSFLKERLKVLKDLKREARRRVKNREVTYDWWANFNFRLAFLSVSQKRMMGYQEIVSREISRFNNLIRERKNRNEDIPGEYLKPFNNIFDYFKTHEDMEAFIFFIMSLPRMEGYGVGMSNFQEIKELFPKEVMFFTTNDLGIMAFNQMGFGSYFVGVLGSEKADGRQQTPMGFLLHDMGHIKTARENFSLSNDSKMELIKKNKEIEERLNDISDTSDREKAELALFLFQHESGKTRYVKEAVSSFVEKRKEMLDSVMRELYIDNVDGMLRLYKKLLPDHLQDPKTIQDREQIQLFLRETADIFSANFVDILAR